MISYQKVKEKIMRCYRALRAIVTLACFSLSCSTGLANAVGDVATSGDLFRIGFIPGDPEAQISSGVIYDLREYLLGLEHVRVAMAQENVRDIVLLAADSHENLVQRMTRNEFDLVFCSSVDFVTQRGDYEARFQLRRPEDSFDPRGNRVFHKGVIFVNNRSPLFRRNFSASAIADTLTTARLALVSSSAAGYYYPCLKISQLSSRHDFPQQLILCESSEQAVKAVINGLGGTVDAGACDAGVIEKVFAKHGLSAHRNEIVEVLLETDPIPTDPVALHVRRQPRYSPLGFRICEALQAFFTPERGLPRLEQSSSEKFRGLRENIEEFWQKHRDHSSGAPLK